MKKYYGEVSENHEHINIYTREEFEKNKLEETSYSHWADTKTEIYDKLQVYIDNADSVRENYFI